MVILFAKLYVAGSYPWGLWASSYQGSLLEVMILKELGEHLEINSFNKHLQTLCLHWVDNQVLKLSVLKLASAKLLHWPIMFITVFHRSSVGLPSPWKPSKINVSWKENACFKSGGCLVLMRHSNPRHIMPNEPEVCLGAFTISSPNQITA